MNYYTYWWHLEIPHLKKEGHINNSFDGSLSKILMLIWWFWAKLNVWWRACHRSLISIHGWLLYCKASIAGNLCLLTYFIRSHSLKFLDTISWILSSKNLFYLTLFIPPSFRLFDNLDNFWMFVPYWFWSIYIFLNNEFKRIVVRDNWSVDVPNNMDKIGNKFFSSLLFLMIVHHLSWINSSVMTILMVRGVWSDGYQISGLMLWLLISIELEQRKNRSITKFVLLALSEYQVGICWIGLDSLRSKESAICNRELLWDKWKG